MSTTFGDSDSVSDISYARIWISSQMNENVSVVREKGPLATDF